MTDRIPMTRTGYDKIKAELAELENVQMPEIEKRIAAARAEGDLKENAEYHGARESQGLLQAKINQMKAKLAYAEIIDPATMPRDQVVLGATVKFKDLDRGFEDEMTLVGAGEEDYDANKFLVTGPVPQALLGKKVGDVATAHVPAGVQRLQVLEIKFE